MRASCSRSASSSSRRWRGSRPDGSTRSACAGSTSWSSAGYQPGDPESQAAFLEANREFHLAIAEASGNARLIRMVNSCMEEIGRLLHIGLAADDYGDRYQHEHRELIQALIEGDADAAESITYAAIRGGEEMVLQALLQTSTLVDVPAPLARSPRAASSRP